MRLHRRSMKARYALLGIFFSVVIAAACSKSKGDGGPPPVYFGTCHKVDQVAACSGSHPASLAPNTLAAGFLQDVVTKTHLTGALGRRVDFGDVNGDGYPDVLAIETGVTPGLQHLYLNQPALAG